MKQLKLESVYKDAYIDRYRRLGYTVVSVTESEDNGVKYSLITLRRDENIPSYGRLVELEAEVDSLCEQAKKAGDAPDEVKTKRKKAEFLKKRLLQDMQAMRLKKVDMPRAKITFSEGRDSVVIDDERQFIDYAETFNESLIKYSKPTICKSEVKKLLDSGEKLPAVHLEKKPYITIK